jgi:putative hydrolase of the HAD superfamily
MAWLLCDYGEVLCLPQPEADKTALEHAAGGQGTDFWERYWTHRPGYDRADVSVSEYWAAVLGVPPTPGQLRSLVELDIAGWLHPNPASLAATARAARRGLHLALFSNAPLELATAIDSLDWLAGFWPRLFSCRLRAVKPEPAAYAAVVDALDARPDQIAFLDDRPANVAAAREAGLRAHVFTDPGQIDAVAVSMD